MEGEREGGCNMGGMRGKGIRKGGLDRWWPAIRHNCCGNMLVFYHGNTRNNTHVKRDGCKCWC